LAGEKDMTDQKFSIVFMGTPEFAVSILDKLYQNDIDIKAVITAPDKPSGRGQKVNMSAVKKFALEKDLHVLQPTNLKDPDFLSELEELNADLFVVVAFRMLPEVVWSMPPRGTINLHASLLPNYRGAAPINWAIINGEEKTGVTTFFIEKEIDTGEIIERAEVSIGENETVGELYSRLMTLGADVMLSTVGKINKGGYESIPQDSLLNNKERPAPKIFKSDCKIDFTKTVKEVHNFCRGMSPYPASWCTLYNRAKNETKTYKVFSTRKTSITIENSDKLLSDKEGILIPCSDYYLRILDIQPEGKRRMQFDAFLAGNNLEDLELVKD
jgi:methionyl-tRNA formyltransferase